MTEVSFAPIQAGLVNIGNLFALDLAFKSSNVKKFDQIFSEYKKQKVKSDRFYDFLDHMVDACTCHEFKHMRFFAFEKTVSKTTCPTKTG